MNMIVNPILPGFHPDPCICRKGDDYYIATSTFEWFPGVRIFHSKDLQHWQLVSRPLNRVSQLDMKGDPDSGGIWAPCLSYADGLFWLVYTDVKVVNSPWKNGRNYLVTAQAIEGPWSEPVFMGNGGFDPTLFHDGDGRKYYIYRPWGPRHHSDPFCTIVMQEYFPQRQALSPQRKTLFTGTELKYTEGPHIYHIGDYYYLLMAEGGTGYEHAVIIARARQIDGPYELHPETALLTAWPAPRNPLQKTGHGSIIHTHTDEWYMVFLASRPLKLPGIPLLAKNGRGYCPLGRETAIEKLYWRDDWPWAAEGQHARREVEAPSMPEVIWDESPLFFDDFDSPDLNPHFQTLRIPFSDEIGSLTAHKGHLRLYGKDSLLSTFTQATVARRWQHFAFTAQTRLAFSPGYFQQSAGLTCYYNTGNWTYCFIDYEEGKGRTLKIIQLDSHEAHYFLYDDPIVIPDAIEYVWLRVQVDHLRYGYSYSFDGRYWHQIPLAFAAWQLSDDYVLGRGYFTGAFVGMHCADISGDGCFADFDSFSYIPGQPEND